MPSLRGIELVPLATHNIYPSRYFVVNLGLMSSTLLNLTTRESCTVQARISIMCPRQKVRPSVHQTHPAWTVARLGFVAISGFTRLTKVSRRWMRGTLLYVESALWGMTT